MLLPLVVAAILFLYKNRCFSSIIKEYYGINQIKRASDIIFQHQIKALKDAMGKVLSAF